MCKRTVLDMVGFIAIVSFVVDKLRFSSSSCPDENTRKISFFIFVFKEAEEVNISD